MYDLTTRVSFEHHKEAALQLLRSTGHYLFALALIALAHTAQCQDQAARHYRVLVHHTSDGLSPKSMMAVMQQWINATDLDHDKNTRALLFTTDVPLHLEQLRERLAPTGYHVLGFTASRMNGETEDRTEGMPPFPNFFDTGNELEDHARYDAQKIAWIAAWPLEYERMISTRAKPHGE